MHERLKNWMDSMALKPSLLAKNLDVNSARISHILSGRNKPSIDFLEKLLSAYPNFNMNWLISGIGFMNINELNKPIDTKGISKITVFYNDKSFEEIQNNLS